MRKLVSIDGKTYLVPKEILPKGRHREIGNCPFCGLPVYASEGQAIKWKTIHYPSGKKSFPTHKKCRTQKQTI